jgi:hypothetical protein
MENDLASAFRRPAIALGAAWGVARRGERQPFNHRAARGAK